MNSFRNLSTCAYASAYKNGWLNDYYWLERERIKRGFWQDYNNCYNEAKKYARKVDFMNNARSAYVSALRKGWLKDYTWFKKNINQLKLFDF